MTAAKNKATTSKLNLAIVATSLHDFVQKMNGLDVSPEQQELIDNAVVAYFEDVEKTLAKGKDTEVTVETFLKALKANGINIKIAGAKNDHLETIVKTISPERKGWDWKAIGITVAKYSGAAAVGAGLAFGTMELLERRRNRALAATAHQGAVVTMRRSAS